MGKTYHYKYLRTLQNSKKPINTHLWIETPSGIYFVDSTNELVLLKTTDEGVMVSTVTTRTKKITKCWYDRTNAKIYFVDSNYNNTMSYIWSFTLSDDSISEIVSINGDIFDIWIYNNKIYYNYFLPSFESLSKDIVPTGVGATHNWVCSSGSNHYDLIDEDHGSPVTTDYVKSDVINQTDIYTFPNDQFLGKDSGKITSIKVWLYGKQGEVIINGNKTGTTSEKTLTWYTEAYSWQTAIYSDLNLYNNDFDAFELTMKNNTTQKWKYLTTISENLKRVGNEVSGGCWDGTYFYVTNQVMSGSHQVHKYNSNWVYQTSYSLYSDGTCRGITKMGSYFYIVNGYDERVYKYDSSFNYITYYDISTNTNQPGNITNDGTYFYITDATTRIIKYNSSFVYQSQSEQTNYSDTHLVYVSDDSLIYATNINDWKSYNTSLVYQSTGSISGTKGYRGAIYDGTSLWKWYDGTNWYPMKYTYKHAEIATMYLECTYEGNILVTFIIRNHTDSLSYSNSMGTTADRRWLCSQICVAGIYFYFLWKWTNEEVEIWNFNSSTHIFTQKIASQSDHGTDTNLIPLQRSAITYDGINNLSYIIGSGKEEISTIICVWAAGLEGKYLLLSAPDENGVQKDFYLWFDINNDELTDPALTNKTGIRVINSTTNQTLSDAIVTALNGNRYFAAGNVGGTLTTVTLQSRYNGNVTDIATGNSGLAVAVSIQGVNNTYYYHIYDIIKDYFYKKAEQNIGLMLDRNSKSSNVPPFNNEKGFHLTSYFVYQILQKSNLYKIMDLNYADTPADSIIIGVSDTYLILNNAKLYKFVNYMDGDS